MATKVTTGAIEDLLKMVAGSADPEIQKLASNVKTLFDGARKMQGHSMKVRKMLKAAEEECDEMDKAASGLLGAESSLDGIKHDIESREVSKPSTEAGLGMTPGWPKEPGDDPRKGEKVANGELLKAVGDLQASLQKSYDDRFAAIETGQTTVLKAVNALLRQGGASASERVVVSGAVTERNGGDAAPVTKGAGKRSAPTREEIEAAKADPTGRMQRELFRSVPTPRGVGACPAIMLEH